MDIITSYCFACSHNTLDSPDFENYVVLSIQNSFAMSSVFRYFPWVIVALQTIPPRLLLRMKPELKGIAELRRKMEQQIEQILANPASMENAEHEVIYHHWLKPDPAKKRHQLPSRMDLLHKAINFQFAGTDTAGNISTVGTFEQQGSP
jgi:hypothetical protein